MDAVTGARYLTAGKIHSADAGGKVVDHWRLDLTPVKEADWIGFPDLHAPSFSGSAIIVALPVLIALVAENAGHIKAVGEMTGDPLDDRIGTAIMNRDFAQTDAFAGLPRPPGCDRPIGGH